MTINNQYLCFDWFSILPHLNFDIEQCMDYARQVNPKIHILQISATTGEGMDKWLFI
jgi:hydrogenase nickel incorporation protein HypB